MADQKDNFLSAVLSHIKSKEAQKFVSAELSYHIKSAKQDWMKRGFSEAAAEVKAVEQMGSPNTIGRQFNQLHRPRVDWLLVILLVTIMAFGFLPLMNLDEMYGNLATKKTFYILFGVITTIGLMLFDYRKFKNYGWLFYTIGILFLLALPFLPPAFAPRINGIPYLKIGIGPVFESMTALPFFYLAWSSFFQNNKFKVWQFSGLFLISLFLFLPVSKLSTTFIYIVMVFVMLWWSKFERKTVIFINSITLCFVTIAGIIIWATIASYQKVRLLAFFNPEQYSTTAGYQYLLIKKLFLAAGWFGQQKDKGMFPVSSDSFRDLAFVSVTYHFGWTMGIILVIILSLFIARMIMFSQKVKDPYSKLLLIGGITLFAVQLIYNIGMTLGYFPLTAMSLPFISYGLTPTLLNAGIIGIVLSVYRRKDLISSFERFS